METEKKVPMKEKNCHKLIVLSFNKCTFLPKNILFFKECKVPNNAILLSSLNCVLAEKEKQRQTG